MYQVNSSLITEGLWNASDYSKSILCFQTRLKANCASEERNGGSNLSQKGPERKTDNVFY
jgi:hypothetical protein